jgi:tripartite-type tricarboxylate transporter receptor subunit TctC
MSEYLESREVDMKKGIAVLCMVLMAFSSLWAGGKTEEKFPSKTIKLIVPWAAGGGTDTIARALARTGEKYLGVQVIVENKPGGSGAVGLGKCYRHQLMGTHLQFYP